MANDFYTTYNLLQQFTGYTKPLLYDEWDSLPDDHKAAVLYLQFFDQITLAWFKLKKSYSSDCDGVSEILQYLNKNVPIIHNDPKRFSPKYIYRVAFNCLDCVTWTGSKYGKWFENETSNLVNHGDEVLDLFDTVVDNEEDDNRFKTDDSMKKFWELIEDQGQDTVSVVAQMLGMPSMPGQGRRKRVSEERRREIVENLRTILEPYKEMFDLV